MKLFKKKRDERPSEDLAGEWIFDAVRAVADAALEGPDAARQALLVALLGGVDAADGALFLEQHGGSTMVIAARGRRFEHFAGAELEQALPFGSTVTLLREQLVHPGDRHGVLVDAGEVAGVGRGAIYVSSSSKPFTDDELADLLDFATVAGPIYALCRAREQDQVAAYYDGLTGVLRSNTMRARLRDLVASNQQVAFAFVDCDNFKQWNDRYGHASGDRVLQFVADAMTRITLSSGDLVGRMGGDEFAIAFAGASKSDAVKQALRLCEQIARADLTAQTLTGAEPEVQITVSIGVAVLGDDAHGETELLRCADEAMYESKRLGRDRVTYYQRGQFSTATQEERQEAARFLEIVR